LKSQIVTSSLGTKYNQMKTLKSEQFTGFHPLRAITAFINENHIAREDILIITEAPGTYTLFYYSL